MLISGARTLTSVPVACGKTAKGFTAAMSQLAFGSEPGLGAGDACGRCFKLTGTKDPYSPNNPVKPTTIVVKANDLCPVQGNAQACGQTVSNSTNSFGKLVQCVTIPFLVFGSSPRNN